MITSTVSVEQIRLFMSIFRGRNDVYARYWEKNSKSGYSPAYQFNWSEFMAFKARGGRFSDFPNKKPLMLTIETIQSHLCGSQTIGIYPLFEDNTSYFIAADFDGENWVKESKEFIKTCQKYNIPIYLERSRSGKGGHIWMFFEEKYPAFKSRAIVLELIRQSFNFSQFDKEVSFDRLFPNQDYHNTKQSFGNLIALPLHGTSLKSGNTAFLNPETFEVIEYQWQFLGTIRRLTVKELDDLFTRLVKKTEATEKVKRNRWKSNGSLEITLDHQVILKKEQLNPQLIYFLREQLNFFNTEYLIKKKIGVSTYQTEKFFKLIKEEKQTVLIPRGFINKLVSFCQESEMPFVMDDKRNKLPEVKFKSKINLYGYQKTVLDEISDVDSGVIVAPSGSGKTIIGLELIARKSQPALILVHRKQLLDQWVERIQSFLTIPKTHIGRISGIKKTVGKQITVAMMQSLIKMDNINEFANQFGTIIVDECHHIPAKTFRELICQFNPYYLYGLTATPKRKYNDEKLIYYYIGDIITTVDPNYATGKSTILEKPMQVYIKETALSVPFDYQTDEFETVSKILIFDNTRNKQIVFDEERAAIVKEMFRRVAEKGHSGRTIKHWLDRIGFTTVHGKPIALSRIYATLQNPFYTGTFEFNGKTFKGNYPILIDKVTFNKVQKQLTAPPKEWHKKIFPFKTLCVCGSCKGGVTAEEKYKKLKYGGYTKHIYYHCARSVDYECDEPYITEEDLIQQLIAHIDGIRIDEKLLTKRLKEEIERFHILRSRVLHQEYLSGNLNQFDYPEKDPLTTDMGKGYLLHVLKAGTAEERQQILAAIKTKFILTNRELRIK